MGQVGVATRLGKNLLGRKKLFRKVSFNSVPNELLTILEVVVVVAFILASYVLCPWLNKESVATLTGAVIGALAVFFGNLQNQ